MINEIAGFIADQVEATERYFMDTYLKHVYKFQVSILRVPLIKEVTGKVQKFKNSQTDDSSDTFDPLSKTEKQVLIDDAFSLAGDYDTVIKESVEDGIRRTFINKTMVQGLVDGYGTTKIKRADGTEFPRIKQLNKDSLVIQYEAGQITEKRVTGQAEFFEDNPTRKGRTQMIVNRLTNDLLYEARSVAFDLINEKVFATKELKRGGWGDSATVRRNEPAIKGHGDLKGNLSGTKVQPVGKKQTTVAVISLAKNWKTIAGNRKAKFEKNYMQEVLDAHDEVYTRIEGQLDAIFEINRFQDYVTKPEMYEKLDVNLHATDQKGNAAMGSFDVQGIKDTLKNRIADKVLADITKGISKKSKKYLEMKGSISKKKALEKMAKKAIIQSLIKQKVGVKPDFRLKVNKRLVAKGGKLPKGKKGKASFAIAAKTKKKSGRKKARAGGFGKVKKTGRRGPEAKTAQSPIALRNLLNELLPTAVAQNMGSPALNYRTGRFANSARVEMVHQGARGGTQIDYTYMKYPYQTFEPGFKQGSTMRDPRKIIGESIRELATGILGRQPHTIRRT